jgi:P-type Ca2+ transporter type 2C
MARISYCVPRWGGRSATQHDVLVHAAELDQVTAELATDPAQGLRSDEATRRLAREGPNELEAGPELSAWRILVSQVASPMILLLVAAAVLSAGLGDVTEAAFILGVVVLNAWIGFRQEYRAEKAIASLQALATPTVTVRRDGASTAIRPQELVPGDVVLLDAGSRVPADGRLVEAFALRIEEAALTGESVPVDKQVAPVEESAPLAERASMAYSGTSVTAGRGTLVVTSTGMASELGQIADLLRGGAWGRTPLQQRLDTLVRGLAIAAGAIVLLVSAIGAVRGEALDELLLTAVSLAVAAIPESLPAVVTITLTIGAQRMLADRALIRRLYAVETLGSVTTICSDKTGTLTQNRMTVVALDMAGDRRHLHDPAPARPETLRDQPTLRLLLAGGALCNDTTVAEDGGLVGDPTETALVAVARQCGLEMTDLTRALPRLFELPFDSDRKRMTTVHAMPSDRDHIPAPLRAATELDEKVGLPDCVAFTKGALDGLLTRCDTVRIGDAVAPLDGEWRSRASAAGEQLAAEGLRVLGVAMRIWPNADAVPHDERLETGLILVGLVGMMDPARPEVRDAVATCQEAGVRVMMITGDHPLTAEVIARDLGIVADSARAVTGADLSRIEGDDLDTVTSTASIYARVSPQDKLRIVEALQRQSQVVAMTGDGVNDAPALQRADIGVAMGITGTDVTKDAADMVLQDDNFASIVAAVGLGRVVFDNIRKFIRNILSGNVAEVTIMVLAPIIGMPTALLPLQLLWLNLVTDGLPAMALAVEPPEPGVMRRPPTPRGESLLGADGGRRILVRGAVLTALTFVPAYILWQVDEAAWQTLLFTSIAFAELAGGFAMRSERTSLRRLGLLTNRPLVAAVALTVALQVLLVVTPWARDVFGLRSLEPAHWLLAVGIALTYLGAVELEKWFSRRSRPDSAGSVVS